MIKTLRITSILAAVLAVIFVGFFVFRIVQGVRGDEEARELLDSPSVIEKFKAAEGDRTKTIVGQTSPLVKEAQSFALYLNPPAPKINNPQKNHGTNAGAISAKVNVTPKFPVIGISYCEKRPEMSMALIDEPGKGIHWVKQSAIVGHFVIEKVENDFIIVKSGTETSTINLERKLPNALSGSSKPKTMSKPAGTAGTGTVNSSSGSRSEQQMSRIRNVVRRPPANSLKTQQSDKEKEKLEELYENLRKLKANSDSNDSDAGLSEEERAEKIAEIISNYKASNVSPGEAKELEDLGEQLKIIGQEPNLLESEDLSDAK
ncbi:MAG: hypothetical protein JW715_00920 [Sedimentisphaerales bacterium]|nr:hypothetical protein [Sedimentisphaerales bacterium]